MSYKYQQLYEIIRSSAEIAWKNGIRRLPTEIEMRRQYGVSVSTIRQAIDKMVEEGLVRRVQGSGCYINESAFGDRPTGLYMLGFGIGADSPYFRHFLMMSCPPVLKSGFTFFVRTIPAGSESPDSFELELKRIAASSDVHCVLTLACTFSPEMVDRILAQPKPVVFLDDFNYKPMNERPLNRVAAASDFFAVDCVEYLLSRGFRRIGLVTRGPEPSYCASFARSAASAAKGALLKPILIPPDRFRGDNQTPPSDYVDALMAEFRNFDALLFYCVDTCAIVATMKARGFRVPEDISLLSANENNPGVNCIRGDYSSYFEEVFGLASRLRSGFAGPETKRVRIPVGIVDCGSVANFSQAAVSSRGAL